MSVETLLSKLDKVKKTGANRWIASAPTRDDKSPSLTIRELDDGRILLHDFGGDSVEDILGAIGLTFSDLYPERLSDDHGKRGERPAFDALGALRALADHALVVCAAARMLARGEALPESDISRLIACAVQITSALNAVNGRVRHAR